MDINEKFDEVMKQFEYRIGDKYLLYEIECEIRKVLDLSKYNDSDLNIAIYNRSGVRIRYKTNGEWQEYFWGC